MLVSTRSSKSGWQQSGTKSKMLNSKRRVPVLCYPNDTEISCHALYEQRRAPAVAPAAESLSPDHHGFLSGSVGDAHQRAGRCVNE